jgi:hypothetical protein
MILDRLGNWTESKEKFVDFTVSREGEKSETEKTSSKTVLLSVFDNDVAISHEPLTVLVYDCPIKNPDDYHFST